MKLKDKIAIVTGAGQGIGKEIAITLAKEGTKVVVTDLTDKINDVAKEIEKLGSETMAIKMDVTNKEQIENVVKRTLEKFGRIDILVNNAGICWTSNIVEMKEEDWDKILGVNLKGIFLCSQAVLPTMMKQKYGKIVNISSIAGTEVAWPKLCHYSASKAGIFGFTKNLASDVGSYGINVNAVAPGTIETEMLNSVLKQLGITREQVIQLTPLGRIGKPKDIANLVVFLSSDDSNFITGQLIVADGGFTIR